MFKKTCDFIENLFSTRSLLVDGDYRFVGSYAGAVQGFAYRVVDVPEF